MFWSPLLPLPPTHRSPPMQISLKIVKANGLLAMDSSLFSKKGSSDPYCKVYVKDGDTGKKAEVGKTKIIKKR